MEQNNLFDSNWSERLKKDGMATAAGNAESPLKLAQGIADRLARTQGVVNADDVGRAMKREHGIHTLGPAAGSLFRDSKWIFTGKWVKSKRITNHSRMLREWSLR